MKNYNRRRNTTTTATTTLGSSSSCAISIGTLLLLVCTVLRYDHTSNRNSAYGAAGVGVVHGLIQPILQQRQHRQHRRSFKTTTTTTTSRTATIARTIRARTTRLYADSKSSSSSSSSSSLVALGDNTNIASQLFNAFTNLDASDQYDAVLTGICAKILDNRSTTTATTIPTTPPATTITTSLLQDALNLLTEMNARKIQASPRSTMALIDVVTTTTSASTTPATATTTNDGKNDASTVRDVMSLCIKNRSIQQYGKQIVEIIPFPALRSNNQKVKCYDGKYRTRTERIQNAMVDNNRIPPDDNRNVEVTSALVAVIILSICEVTNIFPSDTTIHDVAPLANLFVTVTIVLAITDNFYEFITTSTKFLIKTFGSMSSSNKKKDDDDDNSKTKPMFQIQDIEKLLPSKDALPGKLGQGIYTGTIVRGISRLLTIDAEREASCEAAALYTAYVLGLPCYAYRPNAYEAALLTVESSTSTTSSSSSSSGSSSSSSSTNKKNASSITLLNQNGILRMLVWLLAPVCIENQNYAQLIVSDPREAKSYLQRLEEYYKKNRVPGSSSDDDDDDDVLFWTKDDNNDGQEERNDLLQWAYLEADQLLRVNEKDVKAIANRLAGGAATVGDCVAVIEGWQKD